MNGAVWIVTDPAEHAVPKGLGPRQGIRNKRHCDSIRSSFLLPDRRDDAEEAESTVGRRVTQSLVSHRN
jgi:hypothetical protein